MAGVADVCRAAGFAVFGPSAEAARSRAASRSPRRSWPPPRCRRRSPTSARRCEEVESALDALGDAVRRQGRRPGCWQGCRRHRLPRGGPASTARGASPRPTGGSSSRSTSTGPRCRCSASATARHVVALAPAQDFKRVGDGDAGPTPAAWAPTRRSTGLPTASSTTSSHAWPSRRSTRCAAAARRSSACSTSGWP